MTEDGICGIEDIEGWLITFTVTLLKRFVNMNVVIHHFTDARKVSIRGTLIIGCSIYTFFLFCTENLKNI